MGNSWEDFSFMAMGMRSLNPMDLYPLPSLIPPAMAHGPKYSWGRVHFSSSWGLVARCLAARDQQFLLRSCTGQSSKLIFHSWLFCAQSLTPASFWFRHRPVRPGLGAGLQAQCSSLCKIRFSLVISSELKLLLWWQFLVGGFPVLFLSY
jgi:hypothetical protein